MRLRGCRVGRVYVGALNMYVFRKRERRVHLKQGLKFEVVIDIFNVKKTLAILEFAHTSIAKGDDGRTRLSDQRAQGDEILNEEHRYYKRLYTSSLTNPNDSRFDVFFDSSTLLKLSLNQADSCDGLLMKEECYVSLKSFSKGKSPSTDGLTAEFYLSFWELLGQKLVDSFNYAFEKGEMSFSQKRGIITLIPKKDKNKTLLDNWRPISLLNTDHKIAIKSNAARIAKVLPSLIHEDQWIYQRPLYWSKHTFNSRHYRAHKHAI